MPDMASNVFKYSLPELGVQVDHELCTRELFWLSWHVLPAFMQALLRKDRKSQREMDLEDEVFGKSKIKTQIR